MQLEEAEPAVPAAPPAGNRTRTLGVAAAEVGADQPPTCHSSAEKAPPPQA